MKDNISTRIVLEWALQLSYRHPLDVRSCKARQVTCQKALYRNSEQQNSMLEANCHKWKKMKGFEKEKQFYNTTESPQRFFIRWSHKYSRCERKNAVRIQNTYSVRQWRVKSGGFCSFKVCGQQCVYTFGSKRRKENFWTHYVYVSNTTMCWKQICHQMFTYGGRFIIYVVHPLPLVKL